MLEITCLSAYTTSHYSANPLHFFIPPSHCDKTLLTACFSGYLPGDQFIAKRISQNYFASNHQNTSFEKSPTIIVLSHQPFEQVPVHVFQGATRKMQFCLHPLWAKLLQDKAPINNW